MSTNGRIGLLVVQVLGSSIVAFFAYRYFSYACFLAIWKGLSLAGVYRGEVGDLISQYFLRLSGFLGFCVGLVPWSKSARSRSNFGTRILPWVFLPDLVVFLVVFASWKDPNASILAPHTSGPDYCSFLVECRSSKGMPRALTGFGIASSLSVRYRSPYASLWALGPGQFCKG